MRKLTGLMLVLIAAGLLVPSAGLLTSPAYAASTETSGISGSLRVRKSVVTSGNGNTLYVERFPVTVTLIVSASTGKVQYTTGLQSEILAGTATWLDWSRGVITASASDIPEGPVTALRGVLSTGSSVTLMVVERSQ